MPIKAALYRQCVVVEDQYYVALRIEQEGACCRTGLECELILARRRGFELDVCGPNRVAFDGIGIRALS